MQIVNKFSAMKKIVFIAFTFCTLVSFAQQKSTIETRALIEETNIRKGDASLSARIAKRYPLMKDANGISIMVLAKTNGQYNKSLLLKNGIVETSRVADIVTLRVPIDKLQSLEVEPGITTYSVCHRVAPTMDKTRVDTRTDSVQGGLGVPMPFDGEGVLIGITDWGFDYTHPNINPRNNPHIFMAWDQFKNSGPAPDGFDYGTLFSGYEAVRAAQGDTAGLYGHATHGTHVAGICNGVGRSGHVVGQAPGAKLLLGSWYLNEGSWLDQVAWMYGVAKAEGKRLVINSSWGMYTFSTLDGTSLLSQAINAYSDSGIVFVTSGGNCGDDLFHIRHTFDSDDDTLASIATYYSGGIGEALIYWGEPSAPGFRVGFAMIPNNDPTTVYYSPSFSTNDNITYLESCLPLNGDTVCFDVMTESANPLDNRPHALLNVDKINGYKLMMICMADSGTMVNVWNVCNLENGAGNMGFAFSSSNINGCVDGDNSNGIGEPACAEKTISVAAHISDYYFREQYIEGNVTAFSSKGPTLDGRRKPEISAPGSNVVSSISSWCDDVSSYSAVYEQISGGRRYIWSTMSGTSMASPAVTGVVALMLQANPHLTSDEVKQILLETSRNDSQTGPLHACDSMSDSWGWGKVDALKAVNEAYDRNVSIDVAAALQPELVVYPNPTKDKITILSGSNKGSQMVLFSIDGRQLMAKSISGESTLDLSPLPEGIYFLQVRDHIGVRTSRIVKLD